MLHRRWGTDGRRVINNARDYDDVSTGTCCMLHADVVEKAKEFPLL
jgi:hypothetical protein